MKLQISKNNIISLILFLYFVSISAFQLGSGMDAIIVRISYLLLIGISLISYKNIKITSVTKWYVIFWLWYFLSIIWSNGVSDTIKYINAATQIIGISLIIPMIIDDNKNNSIDRILWYLFLSMVFTSVLVCIRTPYEQWTSRLGESVGLYSNEFGLRTALSCVIGLFLLKNKENKQRKKLFIILSIILLFIMTLFSGSKKALIAVVIGLIIYEIASTPGAFKKIFKVILLGVFVVYLSSIIFTNQALYNVIGRRIEKTIATYTNQTANNMLDYSLTERRFYKNEAQKLFLSSPIYGVGGNGFVTYLRNIGYHHVAYCHNNYLELLSTLGVIGFIIYYAYIFKISKKILNNTVKKIKKREKITYSYELLMLILIILILITDFSNVSYFRDFICIIMCISSCISNNYIDIKESD